MNKILFTGNLGHDCEVKTLPSGQIITNFDVAVTIGYGDNKRTEWRGCSIWGERGEKLAPYLTKGTKVGISGTPTCEFWIGKQSGEPNGKITVRVDDVTLLGGQDAPTSDVKPFKSAEHPSTHTNTRLPLPTVDNEDSEDVPF